MARPHPHHGPFGAALLLAVVHGCTAPGASGGEGGGEATTLPMDGSDASGSDTTGTGTDVDPPADDSGSSGEACSAGPPCPDPDPVDLPQCEQLGAPACGDGLIGALEECEGGAGCRTCVDASEPEPWIMLGDADIATFVPLDDGGAMIMETVKGPVTRYHADASVMWSQSIDESSAALAVDAAGDVYVAGSSGVPGWALPWVASWDATGAERWSTLGTWFGVYRSVATDATRLVVAGFTEQQNTPTPRGLVAQYDHEGGLQWSEKITSIRDVYEMVLVDDEIALLAAGLDWWGHRVLLRVDGEGAVRWSVDVSIVDGADYGAWGIVPDGEGGTWIYGQREQGPWARRHDGNGVVLGDLDCIGATAGSLWQLSVEPDGSLVAAILVSDEVAPIDRDTPWLARISTDGTVLAGVRLGDGDTLLRTSALARWPDGTLAVGVDQTNPNLSTVMVIEP